MDEMHVLLCCGAGFSSGMLAQQSRKYVKKEGLKITVEARSESQISGYLDKINVLLLGPHYSNELQHFTDLAMPHNVKVAVIPQDIYGQIDGKRLVEFAQNLVA